MIFYNCFDEFIKNISKIFKLFFSDKTLGQPLLANSAIEVFRSLLMKFCKVSRCEAILFEKYCFIASRYVFPVQRTFSAQNILFNYNCRSEWRARLCIDYIWLRNYRQHRHGVCDEVYYIIAKGDLYCREREIRNFEESFL